MSEMIKRVAKALFLAEGVVYAGMDPGPFELWPEEDDEALKP